MEERESESVEWSCVLDEYKLDKSRLPSQSYPVCESP